MSGPASTAARAAVELAALLGPAGWLDGGAGADVRGHVVDWLGRGGHAPLGVARPASTEEVAGTLRIAHGAGLSVVAQGGNTSLCGGAPSTSCS